MIEIGATTMHKKLFLLFYTTDELLAFATRR